MTRFMRWLRRGIRNGRRGPVKAKPQEGNELEQSQFHFLLVVDFTLLELIVDMPLDVL
jgi:hypothetical protein